MEVGLISDTHGLLRPEALEALEGVDHIIHAGDVGDPGILDRLRELAPLDAVRGNVDFGPWAMELPLTEVIRLESDGQTFDLYAIHIVDDLDLDPVAAEFRAVIYGHSHRPEIEERQGVLWINPGSAGPRRFDLPVSLARLRLGSGGLEARIIELSS